MRIELKILLPADVEQRKLLSQFSRYFSAEMLVCLGREYSSPRTALNEAELEKIRLVHVLNRVGIFVYRCGDRVQTDRAAAEFIDHGRKHSYVYVIKPEFVDFQPFERVAGVLVSYFVMIHYYREIAHAF